MKNLMIAIALAGLMTAPAVLNAQEGPEGEDARTQQEMMKELHELMKKASDEMGALKGELAKTSRDAPKPDVIETRMERVREMMKDGKLDDMPEGLRRHIKENPEDTAEATGKSNEEVREIAESSEKLQELLRENPELLKKLAGNEATIESVIEKQHEAEKKLEESLNKQNESAEAARQKVDESLNVAHKLSQKGQGQGQGAENDKSESTSNPREQEEKQGNGQSDEGATEQYDADSGEKPDELTEEYERGEGKDGFQADRKGKDMGDASSSDERPEPDKYKGFWEKFRAEAMKKSNERKQDD